MAMFKLLFILLLVNCVIQGILWVVVACESSFKRFVKSSNQ